MLTDFRRIFFAGVKNFSRNGDVSFASILVTTLTLLVIGSLVLASATLAYLIGTVEEKVDVNVYFFPTASEERISALESHLTGLPEVEEVEFVSRQDAIAAFRDRHAEDPLILAALEELDANPLGASLNVRAVEADQYESVSAFLSDEDKLRAIGADGIIENVNYNQNKIVIERLSQVTSDVRSFGAGLALFFIAISIIVLLTTIRLGIYTAREEISIMRLVGAENKYIRGPFLVEGIFNGVIATLVSLLILYVVLQQLSTQLVIFFGGFDLLSYYLDNFWQIVALFAGTSIVLGLIASVIAIHRYLRT